MQSSACYKRVKHDILDSYSCGKHDTKMGRLQNINIGFANEYSIVYKTISMVVVLLCCVMLSAGLFVSNNNFQRHRAKCDLHSIW